MQKAWKNRLESRPVPGWVEKTQPFNKDHIQQFSHHLLGCGLQSVEKKKKRPFSFPRTAENSQIPAFRLKSSLRGAFGTTVRQLRDPQAPPILWAPPTLETGTRCPAGAELISDPATPGLGTAEATGARTGTVPCSLLMRPRQQHANTEDKM